MGRKPVQSVLANDHNDEISAVVEGYRSIFEGNRAAFGSRGYVRGRQLAKAMASFKANYKKRPSQEVLAEFERFIEWFRKEIKRLPDVAINVRSLDNCIRQRRLRRKRRADLKRLMRLRAEAVKREQEAEMAKRERQSHLASSFFNPKSSHSKIPVEGAIVVSSRTKKRFASTIDRLKRTVPSSATVTEDGLLNALLDIFDEASQKNDR